MTASRTIIPPPIRPTFDLDLPLTEAQTVDALRTAFEADGKHPFQNEGKHVVVTVRPADRHFWSPYLSMEAQPAESGIRLHGRFSPKPTIWTGFMLSYIALTTAGCFGLMFAVSMAIIGKSPTGAAFLALLFLLAAGGMYLSSQVGQRMARSQMDELHQMVLAAVGLGEPEQADRAGHADAPASENPVPIADAQVG